jgi:hypothetical protein
MLIVTDTQFDTLCKVAPKFQPSPKEIVLRILVGKLWWGFSRFSTKVKNRKFYVFKRASIVGSAAGARKVSLKAFRRLSDDLSKHKTATTSSASPQESGLMQKLVDFILNKEKPGRVVGEKAYDSDTLDIKRTTHCIEMIEPNRTQNQDVRPLRRYLRRWTMARRLLVFKTTDAYASVGNNSNSLSSFSFISLAPSSHAGSFGIDLFKSTCEKRYSFPIDANFRPKQEFPNFSSKK